MNAPFSSQPLPTCTHGELSAGISSLFQFFYDFPSHLRLHLLGKPFLSPENTFMLSSGVPEDHGQYHLVGKHSVVTAVSPNGRVGLSNRTRGYCFPQQPCQSISPRKTFGK